MTRLIVTPIDPTQPGSYKARKEFMALARQLQRLRDQNTTDMEQIVGAYEAVESFLFPRLRTDNGVSVEEILETLSAQEFDQLLGAVTFGGEDAVPPVSASDSSSPFVDTENPLTG